VHRQLRLTGAACLAVAALQTLSASASAQAPASACPLSHTTNTTAVCPQASDTTPTEGQAVSATTGEWTGTQPFAFSYQWQRCTAPETTACTNIPGENEPQHLVAPADTGQRLRVVVTASNGDGSGVRASAITSVVSAGPSTQPGFNQVFPASIEVLSPGDPSSPEAGDVLRVADGSGSPASSDGWFNPKATTIAFAWRRCDVGGALETCFTIPGATGREYTLAAADGGHSLRARVTGTNFAGSRALVSPPTGGIPEVPDSGGSGMPASSDTVPPAIASLTLSPRAFHAARFGASISAAARGTTVTYQISEPAQATYRIERAARGVKRAGRCAKRTKSTPAKAKACLRYVALKPLLSEEVTEGENSFRFTGRLGGAPLRPGNYRFGVEAGDAAGNRTSVPLWRKFTILPPRKAASG
jgi:hypothetical protein